MGPCGSSAGVQTAKEAQGVILQTGKRWFTSVRRFLMQEEGGILPWERRFPGCDALEPACIHAEGRRALALLLRLVLSLGRRKSMQASGLCIAVGTLGLAHDPIPFNAAPTHARLGQLKC